VIGRVVVIVIFFIFIVVFLPLFLVRLLAKEDICGFVGIFGLAFVAVELLLKARPRIGSPPKSAPSKVSVASRSYRVSTVGIRQKAIISSNEGM
jgi:hypothetical protein